MALTTTSAPDPSLLLLPSSCFSNRVSLLAAMGKTPTHKNKGKRGHKLSHKTARRAKSLSSPADLIYAAFHVPKARRGRGCEAAHLRVRCLRLTAAGCDAGGSPAAASG